MAENLTQEEGWGSLGPPWLRGCLNRHSAVLARFASTMDRQRAFANAPGPIKDYFQKLGDIIIYCKIKKENMWNMGKKGFTIGTANHAKVIACAGRRPPQAIYNGTHELITVIECCGARLKMLVPTVVFKGPAYYCGWYSVVTKDTPGHLPTAQRGTAQVRLGWNGFGISMQEPHQPLLLSTDFSS